jgi:hypothetical protein
MSSSFRRWAVIAIFFSMYQSTIAARRCGRALRRLTLPLPAGDELERPGGDLRARRHDADDHWPQPCGSTRALAHRRHVADALGWSATR